jgi:PIN domain nuclease of toxin-antitoxin system
LLHSPAVDLHAVDVHVADAYFCIDRDLLRDPWDRLIVATAMALALPLVTRDSAIRGANLVETVW